MQQTTTHRERVRDALLGQIVSGSRPRGSRLEPVRIIAREFGVSTRPVMQALDDLESQGYVRRRHGSGVEVIGDAPPLRMRDAVMLCLEAGAHVFGELTSRMAHRLMIDGMAPTIVDVGAQAQRTQNALRRALASEAGIFVVHGQLHFPFELLVPAARAGRKIIGVVDWHTETVVPGVHRVLADHRVGGQLVADRLWGQGHRSVLLVGPHLMVNRACNDQLPLDRPGTAFVRHWRALGGQVEAVGGTRPSAAEHLRFDDDALHAALGGQSAPTAVFGLHDYAVACARPSLRRLAPQQAADLTWVGYGHTPWSYATSEPFPSIDLNIGLIAEHAVEAIEAMRRREHPAADDPVRVKPRWAAPGTDRLDVPLPPADTPTFPVTGQDTFS